MNIMNLWDNFEICPINKMNILERRNLLSIFQSYELLINFEGLETSASQLIIISYYFTRETC